MATFHQGRLPRSSAELKANKQRARLCRRTPGCRPGPLPATPGTPSQPGGGSGVPGVPLPRHRSSPGVALSINTRGDSAWLSPTPPPPPPRGGHGGAFISPGDTLPVASLLSPPPLLAAPRSLGAAGGERGPVPGAGAGSGAGWEVWGGYGTHFALQICG